MKNVFAIAMAAPIWGVVSTVLLAMSWTMILCAAIHVIGLIGGKVPRRTNLLGLLILLLGAALCDLLQWGGDWLVFDVTGLIGSSTAAAVFVGARILTLIIAIVPLLKLVKMTWGRAFVVGAFEREHEEAAS